MKHIIMILIPIVIVVLLQVTAAQSPKTTAGDILKITPSALQQSMGNTETVNADDPNIIFFNPGGMVTSRFMLLSFSYSKWLNQFTMLPFSWVVRNPFGARWAFLRNLYYGVSGSFFNSQPFDNDNWITRVGVTNQDAVSLSSFYIKPALNLRLKFSRYSFMSFGTGFTYLKSKFGDFDQTLTGLSFGTILQINSRITLGAGYGEIPLNQKTLGDSVFNLPYELSSFTRLGLELKNILQGTNYNLSAYFNYTLGNHDYYGGGIKLDLYRLITCQVGYSNKNDLESIHTGIGICLGRMPVQTVDYYFDYSPLDPNEFDQNLRHTIILRLNKIFDFDQLQPTNQTRLPIVNTGNAVSFRWQEPINYSYQGDSLIYRFRLAAQSSFDRSETIIDTILSIPMLDVDFIVWDSVAYRFVSGGLDTSWIKDTVSITKTEIDSLNLEETQWYKTENKMGARYWLIIQNVDRIQARRACLNYYSGDEAKFWWRVDAVDATHPDKKRQSAANCPLSLTLYQDPSNCVYCEPIEQSINLALDNPVLEVDKIFLIKQDMPFIPSIFFPINEKPTKLNHYSYYAKYYGDKTSSGCKFSTETNYDSMIVDHIVRKLALNPGIICQITSLVPRKGNSESLITKGETMRNLVLAEINQQAADRNAGMMDTRIDISSPVKLTQDNVISELQGISNPSRYQRTRLAEIASFIEELCRVNFIFKIPEEDQIDMKYSFKKPGESEVDQLFVDQVITHLKNDRFLNENPGIVVMVTSYYNANWDQGGNLSQEMLEKLGFRRATRLRNQIKSRLSTWQDAHLSARIYIRQVPTLEDSYLSLRYSSDNLLYEPDVRQITRINDEQTEYRISPTNFLKIKPILGANFRCRNFIESWQIKIVTQKDGREYAVYQIQGNRDNFSQLVSQGLEWNWTDQHTGDLADYMNEYRVKWEINFCQNQPKHLEFTAETPVLIKANSIVRKENKVVILYKIAETDPINQILDNRLDDVCKSMVEFHTKNTSRRQDYKLKIASYVFNGHTCTIGDVDSNLTLSRNRSHRELVNFQNLLRIDSVYNFTIRQDIFSEGYFNIEEWFDDDSIFMSKGYGEHDPLTIPVRGSLCDNLEIGDNCTPYGRIMNRRTVLQFVVEEVRNLPIEQLISQVINEKDGANKLALIDSVEKLMERDVQEPAKNERYRNRLIIERSQANFDLGLYEKALPDLDYIAARQAAVNLKSLNRKEYNIYDMELGLVHKMMAECYYQIIRNDSTITDLYYKSMSPGQIAQLKKAVTHLEKAIAIRSKAENLNLMMANLHFILGNLDKTLYYYKREVAINPYYMNFSILESTITRCFELLRKYPDDSSLLRFSQDFLTWYNQYRAQLH